MSDAAPRATKGSRLGRRPGSESSRAAILEAAAARFAHDGYEAATLRSIAGEAGVDAAMVHHFFAGKAALFAAVLEELTHALPALDASVMDPDDGRRGRALAEAYFALWESPRTGLAAQALIRGAVGSPVATEIMRRFLDHHLFAGASHPGLAMASAMLLGIATTRYVVRAGPVAEMPLVDLVDQVTPSLQGLLGSH